ncbi:MAG TPA: DUF4386 domain-containing protein [Methylomirabilota bacterium]|jgi:hypothetical protein|nr:DUF4386 domain-containing protein [Methylomirabilota bacterium]
MAKVNEANKTTLGSARRSVVEKQFDRVDTVRGVWRPVSRNLALLAAFFNLVEVAIDGANKLNLFAALFLSGGADYLKAFEPHQLHALAYLSLKLFDYGFGISLVFFSFVCLIFGYLLFRSGCFPKTLGVLMTIAGLSYLTNSFTLILAPTHTQGRSSPFWCSP